MGICYLCYPNLYLCLTKFSTKIWYRRPLVSNKNDNFWKSIRPLWRMTSRGKLRDQLFSKSLALQCVHFERFTTSLKSEGKRAHAKEIENCQAQLYTFFLFYSLKKRQFWEKYICKIKLWLQPLKPMWKTN